MSKYSKPKPMLEFLSPEKTKDPVIKLGLYQNQYLIGFNYTIDPDQYDTKDIINSAMTLLTRVIIKEGPDKLNHKFKKCLQGNNPDYKLDRLTIEISLTQEIIEGIERSTKDLYQEIYEAITQVLLECNIQWDISQLKNIITNQLLPNPEPKAKSGHWGWLYKVPKEDWEWLLDIFMSMTDNSQLEEVWDPKTKTVDIQKLIPLLIEDQGEEAGTRELGNYIAAKSLNLTSEQEYIENLDKIKSLNPIF